MNARISKSALIAIVFFLFTAAMYLPGILGYDNTASAYPNVPIATSWLDYMSADPDVRPQRWIEPKLPGDTQCHQMLNTSFARMEKAEELYATMEKTVKIYSTKDRLKIDSADRLRDSANAYANMAAACWKALAPKKYNR